MVSGNQEKFLIFGIGSNSFGVSINNLKEVFQAKKLLKLPRVSPALSGVVNLRGKILSVFNPVNLIWGDTPPKKVKDAFNKGTIPTVLLISLQNREFGVLVNDIPNLIEINEFSKANGEKLSKIGVQDQSIISQEGVISEKEKFLILDLNKLFTKYISKEPIDEYESISRKDLYEDDSETDFDYDQFTLPDENISDDD